MMKHSVMFVMQTNTTFEKFAPAILKVYHRDKDAFSKCKETFA